ncbi:hypothetical protein Tco_1136737 [Tanacetum coccineum]
MLSLRERIELDLEARLMGETLVLNRSLDLFFEDYIELNDLNVSLELRRDQVDDLMPTIEEGEVVEEFKARNDARMVSKVFGYPSDCDHDKKIRIDCAYNLKFSCMIDFAVLEDADAYRDEGMGDDLAERKEIDNVVGESTIWKSRSVGVLKLQDDRSIFNLWYGWEEIYTLQMGMYKVVKTHVFLLPMQLLVRSKNEELPKELSGVTMIVKMVKLHRVS